MALLQTLAITAALIPQLFGETAYHCVKADIRIGGTEGLSTWFKIAYAYSDRDRLLFLVGHFIPKTKGGLQSFLIGRLGCFGKSTTSYVPMLTKILLDKQSPNRGWVAGSLGLMGSRAKFAIPALKKCLNSSDERLRNQVCVALWRIERRPATIIPALLRGLSRTPGPTSELKFKIKRDDGSFFEGTTRTIPEEEFRTQANTLFAIDSIGSEFRTSLWPAIARLGDSKDDGVRRMVCILAPKFCPDQAVAAKILAAHLERDGINYFTCKNFKQLGSSGVPELGRLLHDPKHRLAALKVLTSLGPDGLLAARLITTFINDPDAAIRDQARAALQAFEKKAK